MFAGIKSAVMAKSRQKKLDHFYSLYTGGRILDVGVSAKARVPGENVFMATFRPDSKFYTGLGIENLADLSVAYPDKRFVTYDGKIFPFRDNEFEWVFSNAVIEHVGSTEDQLFFLNEMLRVAKNVFFTTPNKFFPVESHTNALFLHWLPGNAFYHWCAANQPYWTKDNLKLFCRSDLNSLLERSKAKEFKILSNRFFGWPMTFTVICRG